MIARECCRTFDPPALISFKKTIARPYWNITGIDPPLASMATPVMFAALVDARNVTT